MYYFEIVDSILKTRASVMDTNAVVDRTGITKQGWRLMMKRLDIVHIEVIEGKGHGLYVWDMKEVRKKLKHERDAVVGRREVNEKMR